MGGNTERKSVCQQIVIAIKTTTSLTVLSAFYPHQNQKNMLVPNWGEILTGEVMIQLQAGGGA